MTARHHLPEPDVLPDQLHQERVSVFFDVRRLPVVY
jgi:hypothetical protein